MGNLDFTWHKLGNCETNTILLVIVFFLFLFLVGEDQNIFQSQNLKGVGQGIKKIHLNQPGAHLTEFECNMKQRGTTIYCGIVFFFCWGQGAWRRDM